ncbi:alginate O-acetyltransferase [Porphyromonas macacae]|uniref:MBOAT family O-acyltransferase n=1 Tax=Porphyromonas macacae TaxID=28115 RepID=UPI00052C3E2B|nr:MBOAT family protein [Porphyromonas macacae]KGN99463.1 alginate O-acetyltransferase [Porphyromonas macacae]
MFDSFFNQIDWQLLPAILSYNAQSPIIFSSGLFFVLMLFFIPVYLLLRGNTTARIIYVTLFSLYFYYKSSGVFVLLLVFAATSDFIIASLMDKNSGKHLKRKILLILSLIINLGVLSYFKYFNFLGEMFTALINEVGGWFGAVSGEEITWSHRDIFLPVGISFYTFQTMSYIIDIYRGRIKPLHRWVDYLFYVSFFPQLVAGPIVRAREFIPQIHRKPALNRSEFGEALCLIVAGLFKKAVISDYISLNFVDRIFDAPSLYTGFENLMGVYGYALQIYCDFSGYSDMAIGIALMLGFRFNINFDSPYQSATITEFWRRWHISLSSWLKDYLYISLGGNRKGRLRTYVNLMITMLLGGLWHGAAARFILWGAWHGAGLALHKLWMNLFPRSKSEGTQMKKLWRIVGVVATFHFVCFGWIFFRANSMNTGFEVLDRILFHFHPEIIWQFVSGYKGVFMLMLLGYFLHFVPRRTEQAWQVRMGRRHFVFQTLYLLIAIVIVFQVQSAGVQPFIYFQF